jgi:hypothetical protein
VTRFVLFVMAAGSLAACASGDRADSPARALLLERAGAPNALVLVLNPANCAMDADLAATYNALNRRFGGQGRALVYGLADSTEAARAFGDLRLELAMSVLTATEHDKLARLMPPPFVAVVRGGQLEVVAGPAKFATPAHWLPEVLGLRSVVSRPFTQD